MPEYIVRATILPEGDQPPGEEISSYVEADWPGAAVILFLTKQEHPEDVSFAEAFISTAAMQNGDEPVARWFRSRAEAELDPLEGEGMGLHQVSGWKDGLCEFDGEPLVIHDPSKDPDPES